MHNVLFYYSSQQVHTGSPKVMVRLVEGLDRSCYAPYFLATHEGDLCRQLAKLGTRIVLGRVRQISLPYIVPSAINVLRLMSLLIRHKIALVHINELGWNSDLALAARILFIPVIFHIHNHEQLSLRNLNCRLGSQYLFVSQALARQCNAYEFHKAKTQILYNPIDIGKYQCGRSLRQELNIPETAPVVGTVAQICHRKGIDTIIQTAEEVLKTVPEAVFIIAGPDAIGEERFARDIRASIFAKGLTGRVRFLGPRDDIEDLLASLDLFFLPTRAEPFGLVFVEAMAAGVPVVASKVGGIPEIIPEDDFGILLDPGSNRFSDVIVGLLADCDARKRISDAGYQRASGTFAHTIFNEKISQLYQKLI